MSDFEPQDFPDDDDILIEDLDLPGTRREGRVQHALHSLHLSQRARWWMTGGTLLGLALLLFLLLRAALPALTAKPGQPVATSPSLMIFGASEQKIYVFDGVDGSIDALQSSNGAVLWHYLPSTQAEGMTFVNNAIYFLAFDGKEGSVSALNAGSGGLLWRHNDIDDFPVFIGASAYVSMVGGGIDAVEMSTGRTRWHVSFQQIGR